MIQLAWLIPLFPLTGALLNGLLGRLQSRERAHQIAISAVALSLLFSCAIFLEIATGAPATTLTLYDWITVGNFHVNIAFLIDPLTSIMLLVVTGVGLLVHLYSVGYMHTDAGYSRFFTYLNLFMFAMLILVMADNYLLMFVGWEGVGLCSYLLIGFWYQRPSATRAGNKAFIVNRIGDAGFLLGIFSLFTTFGSVRYLDIFPQAATAAGPVLDLITLFLFIGAIGKSAQIPLYVWLPDAMEGPTPVSALIHAATMVTAGVYMVVRSHVLYTLAPGTMEVVLWVGTATAFFAGSIALVQNDIKKVLAYSTVSQLGYMFMACGVGAYIPAIFHLFTHAFFKGLLFLGSGSVIHALSGEQDMRKMGGLSRKIPMTYITFLIGTIAISGIPPFAGFWSKDEILASAFAGGHYRIWGIGLVTAMMTSFYMFRLLFLTFHGSTRMDPQISHHVHEAPPSMTTPLIILAAFSALIGGVVGFPPESGAIHHFLSPLFKGVPSGEEHLAPFTGMALMALSAGIAILGWWVAVLAYLKYPHLPASITKGLSTLYWILHGKYGVDEIYQMFIVRPLLWGSRVLWRFDGAVVDGAVNGASWMTLMESWVSELFDRRFIDQFLNSLSDFLNVMAAQLRRLQTGVIQHYMLGIVLGVGAIATLFLL